MAISRRSIFLAGAPALLGMGAYAVYKQAPMFWRQFSEEIQRDIAPAPQKPAWQQWREGDLHTAWLGHATCLIHVNGVNILTDPIFSNNCGVDLFVTTIGPKRLVAPALAVNELPRIDLILLSHAHFDHWDLPSLRALANPATTIICARNTADLLTPSRWKQVRELGWGETLRVGGVEIGAFAVKHWGARVRRDTHRGYNGYLIRGEKQQVLFPGDTAFTDSFRQLRTSRPIDVALMPIGAYNPWIANHCTPEQAVQMAEWAGAERIIPIHHQTFVLSREPLHEPIERLLNKVRGDSARVPVTAIGGQWSVNT